MAASDRSRPPPAWAVTRLHNAMVLIEVDDVTVLTDPWFVDSLAFRGRSPIQADQLPPLSAIIGSHWVRDHWGIDRMAGHPRKDTPIFACAAAMAEEARAVGFTEVEVLQWGDERALSKNVTLVALEEHVGRGGPSADYAIIGTTARLFFGGEVLALDAVARAGRDHGPFDVAIGPVNGVKLLRRRLTVGAEGMLAATRLLGAPRLIPVHDEHRSLWPLVRVSSSVRDLDNVPHHDVEVLDLAPGERYDHRVG